MKYHVLVTQTIVVRRIIERDAKSATEAEEQVTALLNGRVEGASYLGGTVKPLYPPRLDVTALEAGI